MMRKVVVTGGSGFIGAHLVRALVTAGDAVVVIDNQLRGDANRLHDIRAELDMREIDVRDEDAVTEAVRGADVVMHLAAVNGTENFYQQPELVLDVGIRGALAVVNACRRADVPDLVVASSAEAYQTPTVIPTPETVPLMLPDSLNPRYSYGGSKIISELIAMNYGRDHFRKLQVFRPHNVYGPRMGTKHVIPQLTLRIKELMQQVGQGTVIDLPIQGTGQETRAFCYVSDAVQGILTMYEHGGHREIYHIGNDEEVTIEQLANCIGRAMGVAIKTHGSDAPAGETSRRCPDISKMRKIGYAPEVMLEEGVALTVADYLSEDSRPHQTHHNPLL